MACHNFQDLRGVVRHFNPYQVRNCLWFTLALFGLWLIARFVAIDTAVCGGESPPQLWGIAKGYVL